MLAAATDAGSTAHEPQGLPEHEPGPAAIASSRSIACNRRGVGAPQPRTSPRHDEPARYGVHAYS